MESFMNYSLEVLPFGLRSSLNVGRPSVNTTQWEHTENQYTLNVLAVGLTEDDVVLELQNKHLSLTLKSRGQWTQEQRKYRWALPNDANVNAIEATLSRGVLTISVGRVPEPQPQRIRVKDLDVKESAVTSDTDASSE